MIVYELMAKLGAAGIKLWVEEGQLKFKAPKGALTPDLKAELVANKQAVVEFLSQTKLETESGQEVIPAVGREVPIPLSHAQQRLWFIEQLNPGSSTFHIPAALFLTGILDYRALEQAFVELLQRHEALRTVFIAEDDQTYQTVKPVDGFIIPMDDLTALPEAEKDGRTKAKVETEVRKSFNLETGPLIRAHLYKLDDNRHGLVVTMHHIVTDGWSMAIFVREIAALYAAQRMGLKAPLPPLQIQYPDFAHWQRQWLQGEELDRQLSFWRKTLANSPSQTTVPFDRPRPPLQTLNGSTVNVELDADLTEKLKRLARTFDTTLYVILMAAYKIVLAKWSKQSDLCIGMPVAGRNRSEVEGLIGFFVNTLVIRTQLRPSTQLKDFIAYVKEQILSAQAHQDLPFEAIVDDLNVPRNLSFSPVYQVALSLTSGDGTAKKAVMGGLEIAPMSIELVAARLDLTMMLVDQGDTIEGMAEFNTDLYNMETIALFVQHFEALLKQMSVSTDELYSTLQLESLESIKRQIPAAVDAEAILPLIPMQRDFCLDSLRNPETRRNSIGYSVRLPFAVDEAKWQRALEQVAEANPMLRSKLITCDLPGMDSLYNIIVAGNSVNFEVLDWRTKQLSDDALEAAINELALPAWDMDSDALCRYYLIRSSEAEYWAVASSHHSISDGVSKYYHFTQTLSAYEGKKLNRSTNKLISKWVKERIGQNDNDDTLAFWQQQFANVEPVATRVTDPGPAQFQFWNLDSEQRDQLADWCEQNKVSVTNYLRTLYTLALQCCYFDSEEFVLIDAFAGRDSSTEVHQLDQSAGCFFQFLPHIQHAVSDDEMLFTDLLESNRQWKKSVGKHQFISMMARRRFYDGNALEFQFNYRLPKVTAPIEFQGHSVSLKPIQPDNEGVVKLLVTSNDLSMALRLSYRQQEFPGFQLLDRMQRVHQQIMGGELRLTQLDWVSSAEQNHQFNALSGPQTELPATIPELFNIALERYREKPAVIYGVGDNTVTLTYAELDQQSNQVAFWLAEQGISNQDRVAFCLGRRPELPVVLLGIIKSGAAYIPIDANYPQDRIRYIVEDAEAAVLICDYSLSDELAGASRTRVVTVDHVLDAPLSGNCSRLPQQSAGDTLYYVYTSGSTGRPKGAGVLHRGESNLISWYSQLLDVSSDDRILLMSSVGFDLTQKNLMLGFSSGAALVIPDFDEYEPERYAALIQLHRVSILNCAPSALYPLIDTSLAEYPYPSLRHAILGGEPIRLNALDQWINHSGSRVTLTNSYGPTECSDVVSSYSASHIDEGAFPDGMPIGKPIPNTHLYIVDKQGRLMPDGAVGELRIAGVGVGTGYWQRQDLNQSVFSQCPFYDGRWYASGDLCRLAGSGVLQYVGRKDFQVKLRGLRIEPDEVNSLLKSNADVSDSLTLVLNDQLVSYVVAPRNLDVHSLKESLRDRLPEFMVPAALMQVDEWPLTPNGKVDRKALPPPSAYAGVDFVAPRNDSETLVADIWCQVLKLPSMSIKANFFESGGHSLLATQVVSRIRKALGVDLSVRALFEAPTIEKLVQHINIAAASGDLDKAPPLAPMDPPNRDTLSFAQYRLWFVDQLNQGSSEYNLPSALRVQGNLDLSVLDRVFAEIVARHEVLRTNFAGEDGTPRLILREQVQWATPVVDLTHLQGEALQAEITFQVDQDAARVYSLEKDILFSTKILKLGVDDHVLLLNMHHIVSDGWSLGVLVSEIKACYSAFVQGQSSPLPALAIQYSDFAVWQRNWLQGDALEKLKDYWKMALAGAPDVLRLPTDKPRPKYQTFNGAHYPVELGSELSAQLNRFCDRNDLTPFMVLMGAYQILLSRYANQSDICVGIPIAGRNRAELEGLIGFFINGLVIRTRLGGNPSVLEYLKQVKEVSLGAYAHQDMPADLLLDALKMDRNADTSPGAQVGFALQNVSQEAFSSGDEGGFSALTIDAVPREHKTAKYELSLILQESENGFAGVAEYNTDLFVESSVSRMMGHFNRILLQMMQDVDLMIDRIEMVDPEELYPLLVVDRDQVELRPLSPMQRDMYLDSLIDPSTLKNSLGYHFITDGEFDCEQWIQAAQLVVDSQPLLRSRILRSDLPFTDVAYLQVQRSKKIDVQVEDWSDRITSDVEAAEFAKKLIWKPYDIEGELSEYFVFKLNGGRHLIVFRMNHIVLDGAGMAVHLLESIRATEAISGHVEYVPAPDVFDQYVKDSTLRTDSTQVIDFWQQQGSHTEALDFALAGRQEQAGDSPQRIEKNLRLDGAHWQSIQQFCRDARITPSLYFKALYGLLINTYCRAEDDFIVSEIVGNRVGTHKRTFGNYFQVLPVIFPKELFTKESDLQSLFSHIRQYRKTLRSNAHVSLMAQRKTLPQGRLNFMFNYYNFIPTVSLFNTPLKLKAYPQLQDGPVQFVVHEQDGCTDLNLIYLSDLFDDLNFLQRMESLSQQILSGGAQEQGSRPIGSLDFLLRRDVQPEQAINRYAEATTVAESSTIVTAIEARAAAMPSAIAVKFGDEELTYADLKQRTDALAGWLTSQRINGNGGHVNRQEKRVAICLDRCIDMLVAVIGTLKSGAAYVPMDSDYPADRLSYILQDSAASVLITQDCVLKRIEQKGGDLASRNVLRMDVDTEWLDSPPDFTLPTPDDVVYIVYTSGSTGKPKGAQVTHGGEVNLQNWYLSVLQLNSSDKVLLSSSFGFDLTQKNLFAPLLVGATLVIPKMDHYDVEVLTNTIEREKITVVNCAPSAFYPLVEGNEHGLSSLRYLVLGGEPIRLPALSDWLKNSACKLINSYGPTECTDVVAFHEFEPESATDALPIGKAIANTELYVVDHADHRLPAGMVGELCIGGQGVGLGYLNLAQLTESVFGPNPYAPGNWYRTGDLVRLLEDGNLEYIGRKDFQVKLRGLRIELGEVEAALKQVSGINDSLILVRNDQLVAYVLTEQALDTGKLKQQLRSTLPEYMIPAVFVSLRDWPLTPNGKVDRNALPDPEETGRPEYVAPRNETEEKLALIWSELLGVEGIGIHDNFFDLGGHSLLAARAVSKFRQAFGVDIQLRALFEMHTIADIAQYLDTLVWASQSAEQPAAEEGAAPRDEGFL